MGNRKSILDDFGSIWDQKEFAYIRYPIETFKLDLSALKNNRALDMLIKEPDSGIRVPCEFNALDSVVDYVIKFYVTGYDKEYLNDAYVYLTIDKKEVKALNTHRKSGWHIDGLQGARYRDKLPICYQFIIADRDATEFAVQPFDMDNFDCTKDNFFDALGNQVKESSIIQCPPNVMMMTNAYCVHRSPVVRKSGYRTFIRIEISRKRFDRNINTRNHMFQYKGWEFQPRDIPVF